MKKTAILGALTVASYQSVLAKGDRATAISDIVEITQALERYYSFNRTYTNNFAELHMAAEAAYTIKNSSGLYNYYIAIPNSTAINSVPQGAQYGPSYSIYAKPTTNNRDKWILAIDGMGFKTHYASGTTTKLQDWP